MDENITIELYKDGDEIAINELFNNIFDQNRILEEWEWKFKRGPVDARPLIALAKDGNRIIGQYCNLAYYLKYLDKIVKVAQPVDNMVHNDYRGGAKGVQFEMFSRMEDIAQQNSIALGIGFPNREAYIVGKRFLKYSDLFKAEHLYRRLSWRLAISRKIKNPVFTSFTGSVSRVLIRTGIKLCIKKIPGITYRWVQSFDRRADILWEEVNNQYNIMVKRDFRYLSWRYCEKPHNNYSILLAERGDKLVGVSVVTYSDYEGKRIGFIMELLALNELHLKENIIAKSLMFLSQRKTDYVLAKLSPEDPVKSIFKKMGFISREGVWDPYIVHMIFDLNIIKQSIIQDSTQWHISFGDCDSI